MSARSPFHPSEVSDYLWFVIFGLLTPEARSHGSLTFGIALGAGLLLALLIGMRKSKHNPGQALGFLAGVSIAYFWSEPIGIAILLAIALVVGVTLYIVGKRQDRKHGTVR